MHIKTFTYQAGDAAREEEMNKFLDTNRIIDIEQQFFQTASGGSWSFCVRYTPSVGLSAGSASSRAEKKDYKKELSMEHFAIFSRLRELRKQLSARDAVQPYIIFTDEELAQIAQLSKIETSKLISIRGIGEKKVENYGKELVEMFHASVKASPLVMPYSTMPSSDKMNEE